MVVIGLVYHILNAEIRMTDNYGNSNRAAQIAEAGADLAVNEWINYIKDRYTDENLPAGGSILASGFNNRLDPKRIILQDTFKNSSYYGSGDVSIIYSFSVDGNAVNPAVYDSCSPDNPEKKVLDVDVIGKYNDEEYLYRLKLKYCHHGDIRAYKGE